MKKHKADHGTVS